VEELPRRAALKSLGSFAAETAQENKESVLPDYVSDAAVRTVVLLFWRGWGLLFNCGVVARLFIFSL
jgi:hypothetical protein